MCLYIHPAAEQGRSIGIFRSLGALARVVGPLLAAVIYWRVGGEAPYIYGSAFLLIPIIMISRLKKPLNKINERFNFLLIKESLVYTN